MPNSLDRRVGADAVALNRAAMGNPVSFNQIVSRLKQEILLIWLLMKIAYEHLNRLIDLKGEHIAVREIEESPSLPPWYAVAAKLRGTISQTSTLVELKNSYN